VNGRTGANGSSQAAVHRFWIPRHRLTVGCRGRPTGQDFSASHYGSRPAPLKLGR
jgi:hypothetical protein